jgi:5-methylcytosine-specific restriction enzyme subunit McrC
MHWWLSAAGRTRCRWRAQGAAASVFDWLESQALRWPRRANRRGCVDAAPRATRRAGDQLRRGDPRTGWVQIEVLPKGRQGYRRRHARGASAADRDAALPGRLSAHPDRQRQAGGHAHAAAGSVHRRVPARVEHIVKRGLRSDYSRGKTTCLPARQAADGRASAAEPVPSGTASLRRSTSSRPTARRTVCCTRQLRRALAWTASQANQQLARELCFVFAEVPHRISRRWTFSGCGWIGAWATTRMRWRGRA